MTCRLDDFNMFAVAVRDYWDCVAKRASWQRRIFIAHKQWSLMCRRWRPPHLRIPPTDSSYESYQHMLTATVYALKRMTKAARNRLFSMASTPYRPFVDGDTLKPEIVVLSSGPYELFVTDKQTLILGDNDPFSDAVFYDITDGGNEEMFAWASNPMDDDQLIAGEDSSPTVILKSAPMNAIPGTIRLGSECYVIGKAILTGYAIGNISELSVFQ